MPKKKGKKAKGPEFETTGVFTQRHSRVWPSHARIPSATPVPAVMRCSAQGCAGHRVHACSTKFSGFAGSTNASHRPSPSFALFSVVHVGLRCQTRFAGTLDSEQTT